MAFDTITEVGLMCYSPGLSGPEASGLQVGLYLDTVNQKILSFYHPFSLILSKCIILLYKDPCIIHMSYFQPLKLNYSY
jgi:hypothetical protein